jgi:hypothetical protein
MAPGQRLRVHRGRLQLRDDSRLWSLPPLDVRGPAEAAEVLEPLLCQAASRAVPIEASAALMMSGGWDSRTLLALARPDPENLLAYFHGDPASRELRLVRSLCRYAGTPLHVTDIASAAWDLSTIEGDFAEVESAIFPHWIHAGRALSSRECDVAVSGVFGEILGGHYGETMLTRGGSKISAFLRLLLASDSRAGSSRRSTLELARLSFAVPSLDPPRFLDAGYLRQHTGLLDEVNQAIARDLDRLEARGVDTGENLTEAFIAEHRGAQYIGAQALSTRGKIGVSAPFLDPPLLEAVSRVPMRLRLHNRVNRQLLKRLAPRLLRSPLAATLVPARAPLLIQELSRGVRKAYEEVGWAAHLRSGGRIPSPRLGWVNFEFLRDGNLFAALIDDLTAEFWDRDALERAVLDLRTNAQPHRLHPLFNHLGKVYTIDLMLR